MIEHMVWFKLKPGVTHEEIDEMLVALRDLPSAVPGIENLACGEDFSGRSRDFRIGLIVQFTTRAALDNYGPHPAHLSFVDNYKDLWEEVMALDFDANL